MASIGGGLLVLLGVELEDTAEVADELADKTAELRIFPDDDSARAYFDSDRGRRLI